MVSQNNKINFVSWELLRKFNFITFQMQVLLFPIGFNWFDLFSLCSSQHFFKLLFILVGPCLFQIFYIRNMLCFINLWEDYPIPISSNVICPHIYSQNPMHIFSSAHLWIYSRPVNLNYACTPHWYGARSHYTLVNCGCGWYWYLKGLKYMCIGFGCNNAHKLIC